jgi:integrase
MELYRVRIENLDWENRVIFVPDSKTPEGRRVVPMSRRVLELIAYTVWHKGGRLGVSVQAFCADHLCSIDRLFREALQQASLPKEPVLYYPRNDYGTRVLMRTGNLAVVMSTMSHRDVNTAMHYQHPELEVVRAALDYDTPNDVAETRA